MPLKLIAFIIIFSILQTSRSYAVDLQESMVVTDQNVTVNKVSIFYSPSRKDDAYTLSGHLEDNDFIVNIYTAKKGKVSSEIMQTKVSYLYYVKGGVKTASKIHSISKKYIHQRLNFHESKRITNKSGFRIVLTDYDKQ